MRNTLLLLAVILVGCEKTSDIEPSSTFRFTDSPVVMGALSTDGNLTALVTSAQNIQVWENTLKTKVLEIASGTIRGDLVDILLSKDNALLVTANARQVAFWDVATNEKIEEHFLSGAGQFAKIRGLALSDDSTRLAVGFSDGSVTTLVRKGKGLKTYQVHSKSVDHLYFNPQGNQLLTAGDDGKVRRWAFNSGKVVEEHKFDKSISSLAVDKRFNKFFASGVMKKQQIVHLASSESPSDLSYAKRFKWFRTAVFVEGTPLLVTASPTSEITGWHGRKGDELSSWKIDGSDDDVKVLDIGMYDNDHLYSLSSEGVLESWNLRPMMAASLN
ncbi:hypothetical protein CS022_01470 [Veronia nyctiphanis]|uniref:Uncharacterized protein n=1 Tax=Veronia nyctiphanis TaxID=1278244 RepID=A0A4Q0YUD4_9GAMM|nr:WD40 repeat domain-containing protein [Veronia nyctiphanis]RXJ74896.1 hypothetical protein CS022_01470 [Veronia nyctiphanis]